MDELFHTSLGQYLQYLGSSAPAPGGGSAVAVAGALAASLAEMVCNVTLGRPSNAAAEPALRTAKEQATELRQRMLNLATEDAKAYASYVTAKALPKTTAEEKATRRAAVQSALRLAADVPMAIADAGLAVLGVLEFVASEGNRHVLSDAEVAALLADACARGAIANIRVNARLMKDQDLAAQYLSHAERLETRSRSAAHSVVAIARRQIDDDWDR